ncbi:RPS13 [Ecytonucleospora hepatopenaei]|uniref:RPS13 n=1 Tax=Ecytonucleospora hepatopenaei TaxID=646526 RepID=A0A1W0E9E2_9MICR|nr:RPS13 [Ecytonucleospora hepatopenaei]
MGRMHSSGKGKSLAMKPFSTVAPTFLNHKVGEIEQFVLSSAKRGIAPSYIGKSLRDSYGVGNCADIFGMTLVEFLKKNNAAPTFPEDLTALMDKASEIRLHLAVHKKDNDAKYRLNLINSRLHRLLRYHKEKGNVPKTFKPKKN